MVFLLNPLEYFVYLIERKIKICFCLGKIKTVRRIARRQSTKTNTKKLISELIRGFHSNSRDFVAFVRRHNRVHWLPALH